MKDAKAIVILNMGPDLCGFTVPNLEGFGKYFQKFHRFGFRVLAFPCDQFAAKGIGQYGLFDNLEKGPKEVYQGFIDKYNVKFPVM